MAHGVVKLHYYAAILKGALCFLLIHLHPMGF